MFSKKAYRESRGWRIIYAIGVISRAFIYIIMVSPKGFFTTAIQMWRIMLGDFLMGFGTRLSQGYTSGYGISGLASLSTTSLYEVITFLSVGISTALLVQTLGVIP